MGGPISQKASLQSFCGLTFANMCDHATLCNHAYFVGLIFVDSRLSVKIGSLKNLKLYNIIVYI